MRARLLFIVLVALAAAGIAAQNWPEVRRSTSVDFGVVTTNAPLGLLLLALLGLTLLVFLFSSATQESRYLREHRRQTRDLQAQRELAEKAEASRFTDLRQHLDTHLRDSRQRESIAATEFERNVLQSHRELRAQLEQMMHTLQSRLGDIEARVAPGSVDRVDSVERVRVEPVPVRESTDLRGAPAMPADDVPPRDRLRL